MPATLVLEDGTVFRGRSFGAEGETRAEIIFHTGMTGYQEVLTDPSYRCQMVIMTYPLIGNYGVNALDEESPAPQVAGFIVKEASRIASSWRSQETLHDYLRRHGIMGIEGIDTRAAVLHIRQQGAMRAVISTTRHDAGTLRSVALDSPPMEGRNLAADVTTREAYEFEADARVERLESVIGRRGGNTDRQGGGAGQHRPCVVAYDFGVKRNILSLLTAQGFRVTVVPARTSASDVLAMNPDGVFLSNGPGDPAAVGGIIGEARALIGRVPMFGICLGHQILGLASGGRTYKLKFGHHGANHPVKDMLTNRMEITSQNHGFCVDIDSLPATCTVTHINLNDQTVEGFEDKTNRFFAVQYHPEAAPGPHDSGYLFRRFGEWIAKA
ncbi:MAG: glutamine-hydrolyzing carbamoyl-phosphate synthase small subunit [Candidatus Sumerlaeota bacterium]|nr:glutamine-hydrolyzing carbamoyl-phosphate synthase small subunit [Candidatus Sumerlaeota bacterium]